jgi:hypothetical protein
MVQAFNLIALADRLRPPGKHKRLVDTIDRWAHRHSRLVDIVHAGDLLAHAESIREDLQRLQSSEALFSRLSDIQGAAFSQALVLYVRATESGDQGRRHSLKVSRLFSESQKAFHERIVELRNRVIAHADGNSDLGWLKDSILLIARNDHWEYGYTYSRQIFDSKISFELKNLINFINPTLKLELESDNDQVHETLISAMETDPTIRQELDECTFDSEHFFGRNASSERFAQAIQDGTASEFSANVRTSKPSESQQS